MNIVSSILKIVKPFTPKKRKNVLVDYLKRPVLWHANNIWNRVDLIIRKVGENWQFSLVRKEFQFAAHSSENMMDVVCDPSSPIFHLLFSTGVLTIRVPSVRHVQQLNSWIRLRLNFTDVVSISGLKDYHRKILVLLKQDALIVLDETTQSPIFFTFTRLIQKVEVFGPSITLVSTIENQDYIFETDETNAIVKWFHMAGIKSNPRRKISKKKLNRKPSAAYQSRIRRRRSLCKRS